MTELEAIRERYGSKSRMRRDRVMLGNFAVGRMFNDARFLLAMMDRSVGLLRQANAQIDGLEHGRRFSNFEERNAERTSFLSEHGDERPQPEEKK